MLKRNYFLVFGLFLVLSTALFCSCSREEDNNGHVIRNAVKDVDGNHYDAVKIGTQVWMKSNLRTTHFRDGSAIEESCHSESFITMAVPNNATPCFYDPSSINDFSSDVTMYDKDKHGLFYNFPAAEDLRGICPKGWHVPSQAEWRMLIQTVSSETQNVYGITGANIAKALASETGWKESNVNGSPGFNPENNNGTGFSAFPGGGFYNGNRFKYGGCGEHAAFWTSTYSLGCVGFEFQYDDPEVYFDADWYPAVGLNIRCVRDK